MRIADVLFKRKGLGYSNKSKLPAIIAIAVGICIGGYSYLHLNVKNLEVSKTVTIPILKHNIQQYERITSEDLTMGSVLAAAVDNYTVTKAEDLINKISTAPLYSGKAIDQRDLIEQDPGVANFYVVGVNVDLARSADVHPGNFVDVYWLPEEKDFTPDNKGILPKLLASNVKVLKIVDDKGNLIEDTKSMEKKELDTKGQKQIQQAAQTISNTVAAGPKKIAVVYLAVRPEDVGMVIGGSIPKNSFLSLAKRPIVTVSSK